MRIMCKLNFILVNKVVFSRKKSMEFHCRTIENYTGNDSAQCRWSVCDAYVTCNASLCAFNVIRTHKKKKKQNKQQI